MKIGTKVQVFEGGEFDDHGEVIAIRGRDAVVRWRGSGGVGATACADLVDLVVEEWSWEPDLAPENPA